VESLLAALSEGEAKSAAGRTLADLLSEIRAKRAAEIAPAGASVDPSGARG
jgi:hypothetical protein